MRFAKQSIRYLLAAVRPNELDAFSFGESLFGLTFTNPRIHTHTHTRTYVFTQGIGTNNKADQQRYITGTAKCTKWTQFQSNQRENPTTII